MTNISHDQRFSISCIQFHIFFHLLLLLSLLLFRTKENLKVLTSTKNIEMDGIFKIVPREFPQLYIIHGKYKNKFFPLTYALLPSKEQCQYERMWRLIKREADNVAELKIKSMLCDFETSAIKAVSSVFPDASVKGCYFHFTQSIWRKMKFYFSLFNNIIAI